MVGVFQNALLRERERERQTDVFSDLPKNKGKRERRPTLDFTQQKEVQKRGKKNESTAKTYQRKRKRERERECFF